MIAATTRDARYSADLVTDSLDDTQVIHRVRRRRSVRRVFLVAVVAHSLLALWAWSSGQPGWRGAKLIWIDFPISLLFLQGQDRTVLFGSLLLGGLQWGFLAAGATLALGRLSERRRTAA
jgi:hypothetical protein